MKKSLALPGIAVRGLNESFRLLKGEVLCLNFPKVFSIFFHPFFEISYVTIVRFGNILVFYGAL